MEREIWKPAINILKEMAAEKGEHLTLILMGLSWKSQYL